MGYAGGLVGLEGFRAGDGVVLVLRSWFRVYERVSPYVIDYSVVRIGWSTGMWSLISGLCFVKRSRIC